MKKKTRKISGLLVINKPLNITSSAIVQRLKWIYGAEKAGHTGTLDPMATGVLPICFGETTKISNLVLDATKGYSVLVHLGIKTNTSDIEGEIISKRPVSINLEQITKVLNKFKGITTQVPTMFSAIKYNGKPLYEYARKGINIEREGRNIEINKLDIIDFDGKDLLRLDVICSKGTYIRTLIDDIGEELGCGAYVKELHRTIAGPYTIDQSYTKDYIEQLFAEHNISKMDSLLLNVDNPATHLPIIELNIEETAKLCRGMTIKKDGINKYDLYRVYSKNFGYIGIGEGKHTNSLKGFRLNSNTQEIIDTIKSQ